MSIGCKDKWPAGACLLVLCLSALSLPAAVAQSQAQTATEDAPSVSTLESRKKAAEADSTLADETRAKVLEIYDRALEAARQRAEAATELRALQERIASAPKLLSELRRLLQAPSKVPDVAPKLPLGELVSLAQKRRAELDSARDTLKQREKALGTLTAGGASLGDEIGKRQKALRDAEQELAAAPAEDQPPALSAAQQAYGDERKALLKAQLAPVPLTLSNYETLVKLAELERDVAAAAVKNLDTKLQVLEKAVDSQRVAKASEASKQAVFAEAATAILAPAVAKLGQANAKLREELLDVTRSEAEVVSRLRTIERETSKLDTKLASMRARVNTVGPTPAIGRLLRRRLDSLPTSRDDFRRARQRREDIERATDRRIDAEERRRDLAEPEVVAKKIVDAIADTELGETSRDELEREAVKLIGAEHATLDELDKAFGRYLTQLTTLDAAERRLADIVAGVSTFARQELLWIPNLDPLAASDLQKLPAALDWLFSASNWRQAFADAQQAIVDHPLRPMIAGALLIALLGARPMLRRRLSVLGELTRQIRTDAFRHTILALIYTAMIASAWPLLLSFAGWRLGAGLSSATFSVAVGHAFSVAGELMIIFSAARWAAHSDGLVSHHFRWPEPVRLALLRELRWLTPVFVVSGFAAAAAGRAGDEQFVLGLARPALIVAGLALAVFVWRFFGAGGAVVNLLRTRYPRQLATRLWALWFPLLLAAPSALAVAAGFGYFYTAGEFFDLVIQTLWLVLGLLLTRDVLLRWFSIAERRLRLEVAVKQREEARALREKEQTDSESDPELGEFELPEVDYRQLGEQARTMVRIGTLAAVVLGFWSLWGELLPALNALDTINLPFTRTILLDGVEQQVPLTLTQLALALLFLGATLFAAKNLSGLLEFTLFQRTTMDPGASYAIVTLCQYLVVSVGVVYAFSAIGLQWSKLQWLVAALGVGLGFGLQEIVANFVSGIILLLERPVRVGDIITVGTADGTVIRIRIRATTIRTWERKELVVPNKEFITGRVLNWTLSDTETRLLIPIGIAYGADVRQARNLVLEAAAEAEHVLDEPKPSVTFASFGDNALQLELRCYLPSMDFSLISKTELHDAIYEKLGAAGIGIAFPQRDVHLDTTSPLDIRLHRDRGPSATR